MKAMLCVVAVMFAFAACTASAQSTFVAAFLPATNLPGYELATLADIRSDAFAQQYNSVGINFVQSFNNSICCVVSISEGFLVFGPSATYFNYIEPFLDGTDTCTSGTAPNRTTFGVPDFFPPPFSGTWFGQLDAKERAALRTTTTPPSASYASCQGSPTSMNTFTAIFKSTSWTPTPAPTSSPMYMVQPTGPAYPAPPTNLYQEMYVSDLQTSAFQEYYNSNGGILLTGVGSSNYCCLIQVADGGYLSYGPEGIFSPLTLLLPGGSWECSSSSNNQVHWLGTAFGWGDDPAILPTVNSTITRQFGYFVNNTQDWDGCNAQTWSGNSITLYKRIN